MQMIGKFWLAGFAPGGTAIARENAESYHRVCGAGRHLVRQPAPRRGGTRLWSKPIPPTVPPHSFVRTLRPDFRNLGEVGIISGLGYATGEGRCYETATVSTAE